MIYFGWSLIVITVVVIALQFMYFRVQKMVCEKYPFYLLRDEIIWQLVTDGDKKTLLPIYQLINSAVNKLRIYNFRFHAEVFVSFVQNVLEEAYKCGFDPTKDWVRKPKDIHPILIQFVQLLIQTARTNSLLLRFSMTRPGTRILFAATIPVVLRRFFQKHPELKNKLKMSRDYAAANTLLRA